MRRHDGRFHGEEVRAQCSEDDALQQQADEDGSEDSRSMCVRFVGRFGRLGSGA